MTETACWTLKSEFSTIAPPTSHGRHYQPHFIDRDRRLREVKWFVLQIPERNKQKWEDSKGSEPALFHRHERSSWRIQVKCTEQPGHSQWHQALWRKLKSLQRPSWAVPPTMSTRWGWVYWFPEVSSPRSVNPRPVERSPDAGASIQPPMLCSAQEGVNTIKLMHFNDFFSMPHSMHSQE